MASTNWRELTFVGFDTETSGKYPLADEVCEIAAVKWRGGQIIGEFQTFVKVSRPMSAEVIAIHNITDAMLVGAAEREHAAREFHKFIGDDFLIAHHAPFDLGFIAPEIERARLPLPKAAVFCSSLLARKAFPESENHKLQTLIKFFQLQQGQAHRALDDARACLEVGMRVFEKIERIRLEQGQTETSVNDLLTYQEAHLPWNGYSVSALRAHAVYTNIVQALESRVQLQIVYAGGSRPGEARTVTPLGVVRNPLDDYLVATEIIGEIPKRYFLKKITAARL